MKKIRKDAIPKKWTNGDRPMIVHTVFAEKTNRPRAILDRYQSGSGCFVFGLRVGEV